GPCSAVFSNGTVRTTALPVTLSTTQTSTESKAASPTRAITASAANLVATISSSPGDSCPSAGASTTSVAKPTDASSPPIRTSVSIMAADGLGGRTMTTLAPAAGAATNENTPSTTMRATKQRLFSDRATVPSRRLRSCQRESAASIPRQSAAPVLFLRFY